MANKNPPANDFAPAWLKIPTYNNLKPSGACGAGRRDEHGGGRHGDSLASYRTAYCNSGRDDFEEEYYGMDNGFNGSPCGNPALLSRRPHTRHDFRIALSYTKAENAKHMTKNGFYGQKGGKLHDNSNGVSDHRGISSNNFNQEFPSLQGDISEEPTTPPALNGSAWEKPRSIKIQNAGMGKKIQLVKKPAKEHPSDSSKKLLVSSCVGGVAGSKGGCRPLVPVCRVARKTADLRLTNKKCHSMEILVKHPKAPGTKSDFLRALRDQRKDDPNTNATHGDELQLNGVSKLALEDEEEQDKSSVLSSSLEAEERLLREMGWKEEVSDDEQYAPLTEDELKEFRDRSEKIIKKNGDRRNMLGNLSPLRLPPCPPPAPTDSSSESDSDNP